MCACRNRLNAACIIWCDNFSKTLRRSVPTLAKDVYSSMLWTGIAVFSDSKCAGIDHSVRLDNNNRVIPAMPNTICASRSEVLQGLQFVHDQGRQLLQESLVFRYTVNTVPLQISDEDDVRDNQHPSEDHSMNMVFPYKMIDKNIGSNIGLVSILREDFYDQYGMDSDDCKNYICWNVDENIFWRTLKVLSYRSFIEPFLNVTSIYWYVVTQVMYDRHNAGLQLRKYMGVSLAWWHSFKWSTKKIMQVFGKDLIAPMFHHLFPDREYAPEKMSLPAMTTFLTQIRLAYPRFQQQLNTSLARNDITIRQRHVLTNLSDLCEFFIPSVQFKA